MNVGTEKITAAPSAPRPDAATAPTPAPAPAKPARSTAAAVRFEELEAYRGFAALLIVIFHTYQYSREATRAETYVYEGTPLHFVFHNLDAPVAWFFALSGFLLFLPFAQAALDQSGKRSARGFLVRRAVRVIPAYYAAILIVWAIGYSDFRDLIEHLTFTQVFDQQRFFSLIGPAWSLAVEVQFYLLLPFLAMFIYALCSRVPTRNGRLALMAAIIVGIIALGTGYKMWAFSVAQIPLDVWPVYFGLLSKLDTFALGMLLALISVARAGSEPLVGRLGAIALVAGAIALTGVAFQWRLTSKQGEVHFMTLVALAFVLLLAATVLGRRGSRWERILTWRPLQFLGIISYSIYLWHETIMQHLGAAGFLIDPEPSSFPRNAVVLIMLSIAAGAASYWLLEVPTMQLGHLFDREGRLAPRYTELKIAQPSGAPDEQSQPSSAPR